MSEALHTEGTLKAKKKKKTKVVYTSKGKIQLMTKTMFMNWEREKHLSMIDSHYACT